ncbi:MAG: HAD family hydrolase [Pseudomonas sp.]
MVRLITFDLDDTLWESGPTLRAAEAEQFAWLALHAPQLDHGAARYAQHRQRLLQADDSIRDRPSEWRRRCLEAILLDTGYAPEQAAALSEQAFLQFLQARQRVNLHPQALPVLRALGARYPLGVLTNGNADIRRIGIAEHFQFAFNAEAFGVGKPNPRIFHAALAAAGVDAAHSVHIGDHPLDDITGAQRAGIRAVWFNPRAQQWQGQGQPDAEIRCLSELPDVIARWTNAH